MGYLCQPQPLFCIIDEAASAELSDEGCAFVLLDRVTDIVDDRFGVS
jgi:hypothetical protein